MMIVRSPAQARVAALGVLAALAAIGCSDDRTSARSVPEPDSVAQAADSPSVRTSSAAPSASGRLARSSNGARVSTVATGLEIPWEIAFLPDGSALVTERPGRVRLLTRDRRLRREPLARIAVSAQGEGGLLGVAIDPRFGRGRDFVYFYFTTSSGMKVDRYRLQGTRLRRQATVLDGIEAGAIHDSGRIHFGPDDRLYVSTGDAGQPDLAQDPRSLNGKYLRLSARAYRGSGDGTPEILSRGHRNAQGFDWQPRTDRLFSTEHGPDGDDEVNLITRGGNYGWPRAQGREHAGFRAPLLVYGTSIAPSGASDTDLASPSRRSTW